jgi:hypothetical protein
VGFDRDDGLFCSRVLGEPAAGAVNLAAPDADVRQGRRAIVRGRPGSHGEDPIGGHMIEWVTGYLKQCLFKKQVCPRWRYGERAFLNGAILTCEEFLAEAERQKDAVWEGGTVAYWGALAKILEGRVTVLEKQLFQLRAEHAALKASAVKSG